MSDERTPDARTRAEDIAPPSRWQRARAWWQRWKDPIIAAILLPTAITTLILAFDQHGYEKARAEDARVVRILAQAQAKTAKATAAAAKTSCLRSRALGPQLADYYALDPKFPRAVLAEYRRTIPTTCPK